MSWQSDIEQAVTGLGYTLVEVEQASNGLLRVFFEHPNGVPAITLDDCERVTRQLQYVLEVCELDYQRLEVSSPGLDRPLKSEQDFERFIGEQVELKFKHPIDISSAQGNTFSQKKFIGTLMRPEDGSEGWLLFLNEQEPKHKKNSVKNKSSQKDTVTALGFQLHDIREARLVPVIDFKGKNKNLTPDTDTDIQSVTDQ